MKKMNSCKALDYILRKWIPIILAWLMIPVSGAMKIWPDGKLAIASGRFPIVRGKYIGYIPYVANRPLDKKDERILRVIISIHGMDMDAVNTLKAAEIAAERIRESRSTLIIAPQFLREGYVSRVAANVLTWKEKSFWGGQSNPAAGFPIAVSSFEVLDDILREITTSKKYPHLQKVVLWGHSAGGQMVQRYAAAGLFPDEIRDKVEIRYVVMNPSTYVYPDGERPVLSGEGKTRFASPSWKFRNKICPAYNDWGTGYSQRESYPYMDNQSRWRMRKRYRKNHVSILAGSEDVYRDPYLAVDCAADIQGSNRLDRARNFYSYILEYYGNQIRQYHSFDVVPGAGHDALSMLVSDVGMSRVFF